VTELLRVVENPLDPAIAAEEARHCRESVPDFARWAAGYGPITHSDLTQWRMYRAVDRLGRAGIRGDGGSPWVLLHAADRVAAAAMWLAAHQVYARNVYLDGRDLEPGDFKRNPEGHLGGSLNMALAYAGYLAANALTGDTRAWLMGQGHCVGGVDSANVLVGNLSPAHAARYSLDDAGLGRFVRDFYSYALDESGEPESPVGSHVNAHTAGGLSEGGYLGFAELQYVHMPLPGERLVAFLSDGAFEEQRGSDWAARWWRPSDSGLVCPIMISNGRRIDQRTSMSQSGGTAWFVEHLRLNQFDPIVFDGRDPAAFVWAILEIERREKAAGRIWRERPEPPWNTPLPYGVAVTQKGFGFFGAGTPAAHNLPLPGNPRTSAEAARRFRESARALWVPPHELRESLTPFRSHVKSGRPLERDHALATRRVALEEGVELRARSMPERRADPRAWTRASPMTRIDETFVELLEHNPHLRPRVGNPDEMSSNRLVRTLERLRFRVTEPEPGVPEAVDGAVITALNEEAVVSAALGNKGGINLVHTYEAFGPKMLGVLRQEILFTEGLLEAGREVGWLSLPLLLTSHTWENAKNERSHQDPALCEALLGELSHLSRVLFPPDANCAGVLLESVFHTHGQLWAMVTPKRDVPDLFSADEARALLRDGAIELEWAGFRRERADSLLVAIGAYQLEVVLRASQRLTERGVAHRVSYVLEPGRLRTPRSAREAAHSAPAARVSDLFPERAPYRVFAVHTRPEPMLGTLAPLHTGARSAWLGYVSRGGTLTEEGMLFANHSSFAHVLEALARVRGEDPAKWLEPDELDALAGRRSPMGVIVPDPHAGETQ
jgi:phosphoketolase